MDVTATSRTETEKGERLDVSLALALFESGAVRFGSFRLKLHDRFPEAPASPIYVDLRTVRRFPDVKRLAVELYALLVAPLQFDLLADTPTAATPLVSSLADHLNAVDSTRQIGMISPRLDGKTHGTGAPIDGLIPQDVGKTALLIDDVITQADSKLLAASVLESADIRVFDVVVLIDRQQGGRARLEAAGYRLHAGLTLDTLLGIYVDTECLEFGRVAAIQQQLESLTKYVSQACIER